MHSLKSWWLVQHHILSSISFFVAKFDAIRLRSFFVGNLGLRHFRESFFICIGISPSLIPVFVTTSLGIVFIAIGPVSVGSK
jgi:hypothetical protein